MGERVINLFHTHPLFISPSLPSLSFGSGMKGITVLGMKGFTTF
jgi:hypothetical protein